MQPHSGTQANMAVYFALLKPGDTVLAMDLACGGHLSHGLAHNFSGKLYNVVFYGVSKRDEQIDYDEVLSMAKKHKPKMIIANTIKGKGVSFMENINSWHHGNISDKLYEQAKTELIND